PGNFDLKEEGRAEEARGWRADGSNGSNGLGNLMHQVRKRTRARYFRISYLVPGPRGIGQYWAVHRRGRLGGGAGSEGSARRTTGARELDCGSFILSLTQIFDFAYRKRTEVSSRRANVMSAEYAGKRQRGDGDGQSTLVHNPAEASATSSADLESMLKQALGRIDSLERQHEEMKTSMGRESKALRDDICRLTEENEELQAWTERQIEFLRNDVDKLETKNNALQRSLKRLASKVQEGWEYPVTIQPYEYWQNKGYDLLAIQNLKLRFFRRLKEAVSELEHGVCDSITVGHANCDDKDLVPHWNALFRSFEHINPYSGVVLYLYAINMSEDVMTQICYHIQKDCIRKVSFDTVGFTNLRGALIQLGEALKSPTLKSLEWHENSIRSTEDMSLFMRALSQSSAVNELSFQANGNENASSLLSGVDFSTYKVLNIGGNSLETNGRTDIPDLIAANPPLETLHLGGNKLNDDDAVLIAQSLGENTHLTYLNVVGNNIQERGMRALYEAVNNTSTFNALSDSNHSCCLQGLSDDFDLDTTNLQGGSDAGLCDNRMIKIHELMMERYCDGDGNVPHLNTEMSGEDSVLLAPFLMESVVRRHDIFQKLFSGNNDCSLGLLYELVREWKMAELFSFR
ncbi:hypothetical protein THAOC_03259, partial [Thalassiosira oceanica]